jgi:archaellum biogenesis ATPase FlaH
VDASVRTQVLGRLLDDTDQSLNEMQARIDTLRQALANEDIMAVLMDSYAEMSNDLQNVIYLFKNGRALPEDQIGRLNRTADMIEQLV